MPVYEQAKRIVTYESLIILGWKGNRQMKSISHCELCQLEFTKNVHNQKYCADCAIVKRRETQKKCNLKNPEPNRKRANAYHWANHEVVLAKKRVDYHLKIEEKRAKDRERYQRDKEKRIAYARAYYAKNKEGLLAGYAEKYAVNPEITKTRVRRWGKENPDKVREQSRVKRSRKSNAVGTHSIEQFWYVCDCYLWRCVYCGCELTKRTVTEDHATPLVRGGSDLIENILPACRSCNSSKQHRTYEEFIVVLKSRSRRAF